ncbi:MAG TPA: riboflavin synthase [bacterium]|nr:riboflavin synthase [bacterium]
MFTGIVEEVGECLRLQASGGTAALEVLVGGIIADLKLGDSLSVQGVCLTVCRIAGNRVSLDVSGETLSRTTLGSLTPGQKVNLERSLAVNGRLGGHIVQGHVDGIAVVQSLQMERDYATLRCRIPASFERYIAEKGSVALDGISLTVAEKSPAGVFAVAVIPTTIQNTTLRFRKAGDRLNLECDVLAKYIESLLQGKQTRQGLSEGFLLEHGFLAG